MTHFPSGEKLQNFGPKAAASSSSQLVDAKLKRVVCRPAKDLRLSFPKFPRVEKSEKGAFDSHFTANSEVANPCNFVSKTSLC